VGLAVGKEGEGCGVEVVVGTSVGDGFGVELEVGPWVGVRVGVGVGSPPV
jgi:hypothetical protein